MGFSLASVHSNPVHLKMLKAHILCIRSLGVIFRAWGLYVRMDLSNL